MSVSSKLLSSLFEGLEVTHQTLNFNRLPFSSSAITLDPIIHEVTLDIEEVGEGVLFIARRLWYSDTHEQIAEAIERGAAAIVVSERAIDLERVRAHLETVPIIWVEREDPALGLICDRFYDRPTSSLKVYGVTGTNGKTSAVSYLAELLTAVGERVAVMGTVEYRFEDRVLVAPNTTPDALVIQRFARQALNLGATALALEVSSHALSLDRVAGVRFDAVGFTSFGRDHLDFHGSIEEYREAKGRLFSDYVKYAMSEGKSPIAVAHDETEGLGMLQRAPAEARRVYCQVIGADRRPRSLNERERYLRIEATSAPSLAGLSLSAELQTSTETTALCEVFSPLIGDYHPFNVGIALGMVAGTHPQYLDRAWQSLSETRGVSGRMEKVDLPYQHPSDQRVALVDYAHTPEAITRALEAVKAVYDGPISVIVGCGGDRDRGKRPEMLRAALHFADQVWLTSDNPRSEDPQQIIRDALSLSEPTDGQEICKVEVDRRQCIFKAWRALPARGALLITGKGHESYQEIKGRRYNLGDQEALSVASCIEWLSYEEISDVPLRESVPELRGRGRSYKTHREDLMALFREAALREGGFSIRLSQQRSNPKEPASHSTEVLRCRLLDLSFDSLFTQVWFASRELAPKHRELLIIVSNLERYTQLREVLMELTSEAMQAHPRPHILFNTGDQCPLHSSPGGWSSLEAGAKIPSLTS